MSRFLTIFVKISNLSRALSHAHARATSAIRLTIVWITSHVCLLTTVAVWRHYLCINMVLRFEVCDLDWGKISRVGTIFTTKEKISRRKQRSKIFSTNVLSSKHVLLNLLRSRVRDSQILFFLFLFARLQLCKKYRSIVVVIKTKHLAVLDGAK
jgi:hypothetical protein